MKASKYLETAVNTIKERGKLYDKGEAEERSLERVVPAFKAITGDGLLDNEERAAIFMILLKLVRSMQGAYHEDNDIDLIGYAALKAEAANTERAQ